MTSKLTKKEIKQRIYENEDLIISLRQSEDIHTSASGYMPDSANNELIAELQKENTELERFL
jgi:hypothetical protein